MRVLYLSVILAIFLCAILPAAEPPEFDITLHYKAQSEGKEASGSAAFTVMENEYGRITIAYYDDPTNVAISAAGNILGPAKRSADDDGARFTGSFKSSMDIYLKPTVTEGGMIRLSGILSKYTAADESRSPLYEFSEKELDFNVPSGGKHVMAVDTDVPGDRIELTVSVKASGDVAYKSRDKSLFEFVSEYRLLNEKTNRYEIQAESCILGFAADGGEESGRCSYQKLFHLRGDNVMLYEVSYEIKNPVMNEDGTTAFDFWISHTYARNPKDTSLSAPELKAKKIIITEYSKRIVVQPGERTEIEVPDCKENPLPFGTSETIVLINPETYKPLSKMPEVIRAATPEYPEKAKKENIEADVSVKAFVDREGVVKKAEVVKCTRPGNGFEESAVDAAYKIVYSPAIQEEEAVSVWIKYTIKYRLDD